MTYLERQKSYGPDKLHREETEEVEEKIRQKQYVSLRCLKGRHKYRNVFFRENHDLYAFNLYQFIFKIHSITFICCLTLFV